MWGPLGVGLGSGALGWRAGPGWGALGSVRFAGWVALGSIEFGPVGFGWGGVDSVGLDRVGLVLGRARFGVGAAGPGQVDLGWVMHQSRRYGRILGCPDFDAW